MEFYRHHDLGASSSSSYSRVARVAVDLRAVQFPQAPGPPDSRLARACSLPFAFTQAFGYYVALDITRLTGDVRAWASFWRAFAFATSQLPAAVAVAATARASANAFIPTNDVDGCGIVKGERIGERFATAMMRDGATYGALGGAFALAGGAGCAALAKAAGASALTRALLAHGADGKFAGQFGCVLGVLTVLYIWTTDGLVVQFPSIQRPRRLRLKRGLAPCARIGAKRALYACVAHIFIVMMSRAVVKFRLVAPVTRGLVFGSLSCWSAGALVSASWAMSLLCASIVYTERYEFRPQSLTQGPKVASEPLMAALNYFEVPFVQHLAYLDLCAVAESGGRGRRRLIYGDTPDAAWPVVISNALAPLAAISRSVNKAMDRTMLAALRDSDVDAAHRISEKYVQMNTPKPKFRHESAETQKAWDALRQSEALSPEVAGRELCVVMKSYGQLAMWGARAAGALALAAKTEDVRGNAKLLQPNLAVIVRTLLTALLACRTIVEQGSPPVRATTGFTSSDLAATAKANSVVAKRNEIFNNVLYFLGITATNRNDANGALTPVFTPAVPAARGLCDTVELALGALAVDYGVDIKAMLRESERFGPPEFGTPNELFDALEAITNDLAT